jgi:predicted amidophosphoribosyltransferase
METHDEDDGYECDHCGGEVSALDTACPHCGERFDDATETTLADPEGAGGDDGDPLKAVAATFPVSIAPVEGPDTVQFICVACKAYVQRADAYCRSCGHHLKAVVEPPPDPAAPRALREGEFECGECGAPVGASEAYCPACGVVYEPAALPVETGDAPGEAPEESEFECDGCEAPVGETDRFCAACGRKLEPA